MKIHPLWYFCIMVRFTISLSVYFSKYYGTMISRILAGAFTIMGVGFIYKFWFGSNNETQIAKVFWHNTRIVHGILYLLASYLLFTNKHVLSSIIIGLDVLFSIFYRFLCDK